MLSAVGIGAYFIFVKGKAGEAIGQTVQDVGSGVGTAFQGVGTGLGTIGREAGDIVVDIGSVLEPFAAIFESQSRLLRQSGTQEYQIQAQAFEKNQEAITDIVATNEEQRRLITETEKTKRTGLIQTQFTQTTGFFTNIDDVLSSSLSRAVRAAKDYAASFKNVPLAITGAQKKLISAVLPVTSSSSSSKTRAVKQEKPLSTVSTKTVKTTFEGSKLQKALRLPKTAFQKVFGNLF